MASFQPKTGCKRPRKRENKNCHFVPTLCVIENSKKIAKKFKNTIVASFQAKIDWKTQRKRENKNYHVVSFVPRSEERRVGKEC